MIPNCSIVTFFVEFSNRLPKLVIFFLALSIALSAFANPGIAPVILFNAPGIADLALSNAPEIALPTELNPVARPVLLRVLLTLLVNVVAAEPISKDGILDS